MTSGSDIFNLTDNEKQYIISYSNLDHVSGDALELPETRDDGVIP